MYIVPVPVGSYVPISVPAGIDYESSGRSLVESGFSTKIVRFLWRLFGGVQRTGSFPTGNFADSYVGMHV